MYVTRSIELKKFKGIRHEKEFEERHEQNKKHAKERWDSMRENLEKGFHPDED